MTIKELIEILNVIEDKEQIVFTSDLLVIENYAICKDGIILIDEAFEK